MSLYTNLSVYKVSYDLLLEIFKLTKNFSREYKYTIGEDLKKENIEMILKIYKANSSFEKRKKRISLARENIETIRLLIRILKDLKEVNLKRFIALSEKIESISKQLTAWEKVSK